MSGAPASNLWTADVTGQPFARALHIRGSNSANAWDIRARCFNTQAAKRGDVLLATFWMRTTSSTEGAAGYATFVIENNKSPYTKSVQRTASAGAAWKKIDIPFTMAEDYPAGSSSGSDGYNLSFWVTFDPQEVEIGGLSLVDYGQSYPIQNLPGWPYEGHEPDAPWRAAAAARIEKIRKADLAVVVKDDAGQPVPGAASRVKMKRHAFGFGTAVAFTPLTGTAAYQDALLANFNKAVFENETKWPNWEANRSQATTMLDWMRQHGLTDVRGHNLIWPDRSHLPADVAAMLSPPNPDALRSRIYNHIAEIVAAYQGKLTEWDVVNEPVSSADVQAVLGDPEMAAWFQKARQADPAARLYVNEYNIVEEGGYDLARINRYFNIVRTILDSGGPLDGIGIQGHFRTGLTPPARVLEVLDRFGQFGKELEFTEFDVDVADEQVQADYTRDFLTAVFSHPSVKSFLMWGFWEGAHWRPRAAMFRRDWTTKPNYDVWRDLVFNQWWTDVQGATAADGVFRARGFLGDYDVEVTLNGQKQTIPSTVAGGQPNYVLVGRQVAGSVTAAGVVNAASFVRGPVAPGEIVAIFGTGFGSTDLVLAAYDNGQLASFVADTRVFFDGVQAPLIYSLSGQVSAIVPYPVSGTTNLQIEYQGTKTNVAAVPVASAAPGIFCYQDGKGQAVAVNYVSGNVTFNKDQSLPKGAILSFYITGEGQTTPAGVDGRFPASNPKPAQPVKITFGGVESTCPDNWIGLVYAGVTQINACVPANAPSGAAVPLEVTIGDVPSQPGVTVRIQ